MSDRLCGYCRQPGHRRPDCPEFNESRNLVLAHTPQQRKLLIESLGKIGLGIGAMMKVNLYHEGEHIALVKDFDWVQHCNFIDTKYIRYSKRVKVNPQYVEKDFTYRGLYMEALVMGNGSAQQRNIRIYISNELLKFNGKHITDLLYMEERWADIVAPSHDIEYDPEILVTNINMPRRLLRTGEGEYNHRGIMPS